MSATSERFSSVKLALADPCLLRVRPELNLFLARHMRRFRVKRSGRDLLLHSHLPPLNGAAYSRFVAAHLVERTPGPSHAPIAVTDACPQACAGCCDRQRSGERADTATILRVVAELKELGVCWLGLTGGEPLLQPDLAAITRAAAEGCAVKLFTTGMGLTERRAEELAAAGLFSVAVSLDHWDGAVHDAGRGHPGAFAAALRAIEAGQEFVPFRHDLTKLARLRASRLFVDARLIRPLFPPVRVTQAGDGMVLARGSGTGGTTTLATATPCAATRRCASSAWTSTPSSSRCRRSSRRPRLTRGLGAPPRGSWPPPVRSLASTCRSRPGLSPSSAAAAAAAACWVAPAGRSGTLVRCSRRRGPPAPGW